MGKVKKPYVFTRSKKRGATRESKEKQIQSLISNLDEYPFVYVLSFLRGVMITDLRLRLQDTSIVFAIKNKVCQVAFKRAVSTNPQFNQLSLLNDVLKGDTVVLYTSMDRPTTEKFFSEYFDNFVPVPGARCPKTFVLKEGKIEGLYWYDEEFFALNSIPIEIKERELYITRDYTVCKKGDLLTPKQVKILKKVQKLFEEHQDFPWMSFKFQIKGGWDRNQNKYISFN